MTNKSVIDIAVLSEEINEPYKLDEKVPVFDLVPKTPVLSVNNFIRLFYINGISNRFCINNNQGALMGTRQTGNSFSSELMSEPLINYINFKNQHLKQNDSEYESSVKFNLKDSIFDSYSSHESGIGVIPSCWTACSRIELTEQLLKICYLYDICNVCCSLTFIEALENIISDNNVDVTYNSIVTFRVSVVFTNDNEDIKDVIVRFNYLVDIETGRDCIPSSIYNKLIRDICDLDKNCDECVVKGKICDLRFMDNSYLNNNQFVEIAYENWELESNGCYYKLITDIPISNKMRIFSHSEAQCYKTEKQNCILFYINIRIQRDIFLFYKNNNGCIDSCNLCVFITEIINDLCDYSIGGTFNLSEYDKIFNCYPEPEDCCLYPNTVNKIYHKQNQGLIKYEDMDCNPLILSICKIF